jgi:hypothetical protein
LTSGKIKGVKVDAALLAGSGPASPDASLTLSTLETSLLVGGVSAQTHDSIVAQIEATKIDATKINAAGKNGARPKPDNKAGARKPADAGRPPDVSTIAGLLLGSPEFQRR